MSRRIEAAASDGAAAQWMGRLEYERGLELMAEAYGAVVSGAPAQALYLEHDPVITYGRATEPGDLARGEHDIRTVAVPRGGLATWHGPGQMVGYIIANLKKRNRGQEPDIHEYLRALEEGLIVFVEAEFGLPACRKPEYTGVWTPGFGGAGSLRKLSSIGISARKWVSSHGFALNINPGMDGFDSIVPCGIRDAEMTSIELEFQRAGKSYQFQPLEHYVPRLHIHIRDALAAFGWSDLFNENEESR